MAWQTKVYDFSSFQLSSGGCDTAKELFEVDAETSYVGQRVTGARQIAEELNRHGIRDVFGLMGDGNVQWIPLLAEYGITYHASRHEQGAVTMADAYSRVSGRVGVCTVTHGPGLTHCLSCLIEARKAGSSVVLLAGDTPVRPTAYSCQDLDHARVLGAVDCEAMRTTVVGTLARDLARAFARADSEETPITLLLPTDVQRDECVYHPVVIAPSAVRALPSDEEIRRLADIVEVSERPLILAGRGAVRAGARDVLEALAERVDALLGTTVLAKGLFSGNPYSVDIVGGFSTTTAKRLIRQSDLILGFGTTLSTWTTLAGSIFAEGARLVQVSKDPAALASHAPVELGIVGDAGEVALALNEELTRRGVERGGLRTDELARQLAEGRRDLTGDASTDELIDPRQVMHTLDELLPPERTLTVDGGWNQVLPVRLLTSTDERGFIFPQTFQALGPGPAAAIGGAVARPDRITALVLGDGALSMSLGELETATRLSLPIVVAVINDGAYHAEVQGLRDIDQPTDTAYHRDVDFGAVARALGGQGATIRNVGELEESLSAWLEDPRGPLVLDCKAPVPIEYWADQEWLEDFWSEPPRRDTGVVVSSGADS
jgi:thiamine pyrophosphate-dependent acetolactate synthase large subunit-like protein